MTRPRLYGRRNERSRANVRRYGTALIPLNVARESYAPARWTRHRTAARSGSTHGCRRWGRARTSRRFFRPGLRCSNWAGAGRITQQLLVETGELGGHECGGCGKAFAVRRNVEPAARAGRVGERHDRRSVQLVPLADAGRERREAEQPAQREPADG